MAFDKNLGEQIADHMEAKAEADELIAALDQERNRTLDEVVAMVQARAETLASLDYPCSEAVHQFALGLAEALKAMKR